MVASGYPVLGPTAYHSSATECTELLLLHRLAASHEDVVTRVALLDPLYWQSEWGITSVSGAFLSRLEDGVRQLCVSSVLKRATWGWLVDGEGLQLRLGRLRIDVDATAALEPFIDEFRRVAQAVWRGD